MRRSITQSLYLISVAGVPVIWACTVTQPLRSLLVVVPAAMVCALLSTIQGLFIGSRPAFFLLLWFYAAFAACVAACVVGLFVSSLRFGMPLLGNASWVLARVALYATFASACIASVVPPAGLRSLAPGWMLMLAGVR